MQRSGYRNRIVRTGTVDPRELKPHPRNWRLHEDEQRKALSGVLEEVGWVQDVIVNERTGYLIDGHLRVALALARGETEVPVKYVDLDEREERLVLVTLDPIGEMARASSDRLSELLADVSAGSEALRSALIGIGVKYGSASPDFEPVGLEKQARLDKSPLITCPKCGHEFYR